MNEFSHYQQSEAVPATSDLASRMAALSHPARIEILRYLAQADCCCCKDVVGHLELAQSTVSQHLKILVDAGLVHYAPERQRSRYRIDRGGLAGLSASIDDLVRACCDPRAAEDNAFESKQGA